jgi:hypothetical protein
VDKSASFDGNACPRRSTSLLEPMKRRVALIVVAVTFAGAPLSASADVGIPLIAVFLPPMWLALIPVVLVEAAVNSRLLAVSFWRTVAPALLGNVVSTLAGIPIMWLILATIEMVCCGDAKGLSTPVTRIYAVTVQAPWLIPYDRDLHWMIPTALLAFAIPCFALSVAIEAPVNAFAFKGTSRRNIWRVTAVSNLASYACLAVLCWVDMRFAGNLHIGGSFFEPAANWLAETVFRIAKLFVPQ